MPVQYAIIEDEDFAFKELSRMIESLRSNYTCLGRGESVISAIELLRQNQYDLLFMDINLGDGYCFEIFEQVDILTPIIFTTAHDEYIMRAFKVNGIDYLLKPINNKDIETAIVKFEKLHKSKEKVADYKEFKGAFEYEIKKRFLIQKGSKYDYVNVPDIAFFYTEDRVLFLHLFSEKRYIIPYSLDQLEKRLDDKMFFRASRNCIVNIAAIQSVDKYFNSRLKLTLKPNFPTELIVSRITAKKLLNWLDS